MSKMTALSMAEVGRQLFVMAMLMVASLRVASGQANSVIDKYCQFPKFLQTSGSGRADWMCKSDTHKTTHAIKFEGHQYRICTMPDNGDIYKGERTNSECGRAESKRKCVQDYGNNMYGVLYEGDVTYQCVKFIPRSSTVVQLAVDAAKDGRRNCSSESGIGGDLEANFTLDEYPWISVNHFRQSQVNCPFTGGFNFNKVVFSNKFHSEQILCDGVDPPVRIESECVLNDGIRLNFRHRRCLRLPAMNVMSLSQQMLCMASWKVDGDSFAILRKANNDRHFYCMRIVFDKNKVVNLVLFLDWTCYRRTDLSSLSYRLPFSTPYITFSQAVKRNLTFPCTDEQINCTKANKDCKGQKCMKTCDQCVANEGLKCQFPLDLIGRWDTPGTNGAMTHLQINQSTVDHPILGQLECVSFMDRQLANTRAILWGNYQNGCYPRFLCMQYAYPANSVMRYRLGDVLAWPLTLEDEAICDTDHFQSPPDIDSTLGVYKVKSWNVALRAPSTIQAMPCVLPSNLPDHSGFVDQNGRRGCISFRSNYDPYKISMIYSDKPSSSGTDHLFKSMEYSYSCVAALTYMSVMTLTDDAEKTALCWLVVDDIKLVVIKTSSCNEETARGILKRQDPYQQHSQFWLDLAEDETTSLHETCHEFYTSLEEQWMKKFWNSQEPVTDGAVGKYDNIMTSIVLWHDFRLRFGALHYCLIFVSFFHLVNPMVFSFPYG